MQASEPTSKPSAVTAGVASVLKGDERRLRIKTLKL